MAQPPGRPPAPLPVVRPEVLVRTESCLHPSWLGHTCLVIGTHFYLAFLHGICYDNRYQQMARVSTACFELDTSSNQGLGSGFGRFVKYYSSPEGVVFSAATRLDYLGLGYNNAPATSNGVELHSPLLNGTTAADLM